MQKKTFLILFPCFWVVLFGCAEDLKNQITRLESEKKFCQTTVNEKQVQLKKLEVEVSRLSSGNDALQTLLDKKQAEINKLERKDGGLKEAARQKESQAGEGITTTEIQALKKQIDELKTRRDAIRIKVLTGNGQLASASQMAEMVTAMGYRVEKLDTAPTANFSRHTVFYAPDARKDAEKITKRLGGNTIAIPLSWPSVFNIILVAGKTP